MPDDWFAHGEEDPYASTLLFRDTTGDPEVQAFYRENHAAARAANVACCAPARSLRSPRTTSSPSQS